MKAIAVLSATILLFASLSYLVEANADDHSANQKLKVSKSMFPRFYQRLLEIIKERAYQKVRQQYQKKILEMTTNENYEEKNTMGNDKQHENQNFTFNWTFMIYLDGDNNLCNYANKKLNEILNIRKAGTAIVVLYDGNKYNDSCLYAITNDKIERINRSETNMGSGATLKEFISIAKKNYSARHYMLEIWGHGNGWMGVAFDKTNKDYLTLEELKNSIGGIDIISFSACYMGSIEVAYALKDKVSYFIAPEGAMLASGLPYEKIFEEFNASMDCESVAKLIVREYGKYYIRTSTNFAAWNLSKLDELVQAINNFSASLNKSMVEIARNVTAIDSKFVDLYEFAKFFGEKEVTEAINETIISKFGNLHGIEIYCPLPEYHSNKYSSLSFSIATHWDEIL